MQVRAQEAAEGVARLKPQPSGESSRARRAAARTKQVSEGCSGGAGAGEHANPGSCSHANKAVYEITAMCQICHTNRVMTVN